ncbi:hypothetical protein AB3S75_014846 [Citrus x aurantiifolia]
MISRSLPHSYACLVCSSMSEGLGASLIMSISSQTNFGLENSTSCRYQTGKCQLKTHLRVNTSTPCGQDASQQRMASADP